MEHYWSTMSWPMMGMSLVCWQATVLRVSQPLDGCLTMLASSHHISSMPLILHTGLLGTTCIALNSYNLQPAYNLIYSDILHLSCRSYLIPFITLHPIPWLKSAGLQPSFIGRPSSEVRCRRLTSGENKRGRRAKLSRGRQWPFFLWCVVIIKDHYWDISGYKTA